MSLLTFLEIVSPTIIAATALVLAWQHHKIAQLESDLDRAYGVGDHYELVDGEADRLSRLTPPD